ncbi:unnamed protein product [Rotaria sp. Silwood1]|nr:unnamed protein product [Rotaria sp. Silwood1]CAF3476027.1 unnamed protein product [Rotaria sp. Silwood1]CAF3527837.1 unnamed protein product [Rotaria sp. Silwood1]CAF3548643.1 unnamed protein product [Rotaria sp. Silwood1]CAF4599661.1 unnamed protein product [Rotaria sp. Silwood1]
MTLVCVVISSPLTPNFERKIDFHNLFDNYGIWSSKLCQNTTLAQTYLTNTRQLITTLESNDSYAQVLEKHPNAIAYFKNDDNEALLLSNCNQFFIGLKNARKLDVQVLIQQQKYEQDVNRLYRKIIESLVGTHTIIDDNF